MCFRAYLYPLLIGVITLTVPKAAFGQGWDDVGFWSADLALNTLQQQAAAQKLEEYRKTYIVLRDGYRIVRGLVSDNHKLHEEFFDELAKVNPIVANYSRAKETGEIALRGVIRPLSQMPRLVSELQHRGDIFSPEEVRQLEAIATGILDDAQNIIAEVILVAMPGEGDLQMMDSERIVLVDKLYDEVVNMSHSVRQLHNMIIGLAAGRNQAATLAVQELFAVRP